MLPDSEYPLHSDAFWGAARLPAFQSISSQLFKRGLQTRSDIEDREPVLEVLGGLGTVFSRDGRLGACFDSVERRTNYKLLINQWIRIGSGGRIWYLLAAIPRAIRPR
jgi:hypothetical protein